MSEPKFNNNPTSLLLPDDEIDGEKLNQFIKSTDQTINSQSK